MSEPSPLSTPLPWDLVAEDYVRETVPHFERYAATALLALALPAGATVLDLAAGPGTLTRLALAAGHHVVAVDFAPAMLTELRGRLVEAPDLELVCADGAAMPLADHRFDAAFSLFGLIFFPDPQRGLRELVRVLKPGGRVALTSWVPFDRVPFLATAMGGLMRACGVPPRAPVLAFSTPDDWRVALGDAGLRDIAVREVTHTMSFPSTREAFASIVRGSAPLKLLRRAIGEDAWQAATTQAADTLSAELGDGPRDIPTTALLATARTPDAADPT